MRFDVWSKGLALALALVSLQALGQPPVVKVDGAWARATVAGQRGTGAFMTLTVEQSMRLVGVSSPVAGVAEIHEMKMEGDVMRMRAIAGLDLPAGQKVELRPGGYHLMLMDLKQPLKKDTQISVVLRLQNAQGKVIDQPLTLPVLLRAPGLVGSGGAHSGHGGAHSGHGGSSGHRSH